MSPPAELLAYRDPVVIAAFAAHWDVTGDEAAALFEDLMAWLWVSSRPDAPPLSIDAATLVLDEMWHEAVLHTERYAALCERWFGRFIHHRPTATDAPPAPAERVRAESEAQWRFLAAELGVDRVLRWYVELPLRHDDAWFAGARRPAGPGFRPTPALIARWQARRAG
jgi:hypothetical protein